MTAPQLFEPGDPGHRTALLSGSCPSCHRVSFPRAGQCAACGEPLAQTSLAGPAVLTVLTAVLAQPPGAKIQAPYDVGVAQFAEGICVIGLIDGPVEQGDQVEPVVVAPYEGGQTFAFRRAEVGARSEGERDAS
jgi:uncharacterized OB-fold protein